MNIGQAQELVTSEVWVQVQLEVVEGAAAIQVD